MQCFKHSAFQHGVALSELFSLWQSQDLSCSILVSGIVAYRGSLVGYDVVLGDEGNPWEILVHTSVPANVAPETRDGKREPDLYLPGSAA